MATRTRAEWLEVLGSAESEGDLETANKIRQALNMPAIQSGEGAPWKARSAVASSYGPGARLEAVQNFYPDARPFGDNFLINDNQLFNPEGLDVGDFAIGPRVVAEGLGALTGGFLGSPGGIPGIAAGASLGGTGAGYLYDRGMEAFGGSESTESPSEAVRRTALDASLNTMGGPMPASPFRFADDLVSRLTNPRQSAIEEVARRGGTLTPGQRGNTGMQRVEGALESGVNSGPILERQREQTLDIFTDMVNDLSPQAQSRNAAGAGAIGGIDRTIARTESAVEDAYRALDDIFENAGGSTANRISMNALKNFKNEFDRLKAIDGKWADIVYQDPDLRAVFSAIDENIENAARNAADPSLNLPEAPSYEVVKQLRTMIGRKVANAWGNAGEQVGLKRLYSQLSDDLAAGAEEIGGLAGRRARETADEMNALLQRGMETIEPIYRSRENPTQAYQSLENAMLNNPELFSTAKADMGPEAFGRFRDTWISRAARALPGRQDETGDMMSPNTLLTNLSRLKRQSPEGYAMLMDGREEGIRIAEQLASMLRESERFVNRSRTAGAYGNSLLGFEAMPALIAGGLGATTSAGPSIPLIAAGAAGLAKPVGARLIARAITSRPLNNALAKVGRMNREFVSPRDLARALIVAGADRQEVQEIFGMESDLVPLRSAGNE